MKLTVGEVARMLNTTEASVYRWIKQDAIPFHRVNESFRFHKAELLEWATARGLSIAPDAFPASRRSVDILSTSFSAAMSFGGVHHDVKANDRESALRAIVQRMPIENEADRGLLFDVLFAREALGSTGVGDGIAIPHVRSPVVLPANQPSISLCFLTDPIDFQAIDERPVHTFFSMVTLTIRSHLYLLSKLSYALQDARFRQAIANRASEADILSEAVRIDQASGPAGEALPT